MEDQNHDVHSTEPTNRPESLSRAAGVMGTVTADERMRHDYPILQQFHTKHALGALAAPSCLCCGQQTHPITRPIAVKHMELPAMVVCKQCKDASGVTVRAGQGIAPADTDERLSAVRMDEPK